MKMIDKNIVEKIDKFYSILNRGYYCDAREVVDTYNEVFPNEKMKFTTCSSCLRKAVLKMVGELEKIKKQTENATEQKQD